MPQELSPPDILHSIIYVNPDILNPAEYNPRKHTIKQIENLKESITRYGLVDPILVNKHPDRMNVVV
jgi:ParB-like chromosome segregation protein Spo0J